MPGIGCRLCGEPVGQPHTEACALEGVVGEEQKENEDAESTAQRDKRSRKHD